MTWPTQEGDEEAMDGSITRTGGWMDGASSAAPPGSFETDAAVAQSTCNSNTCQLGGSSSKRRYHTKTQPSHVK